ILDRMNSMLFAKAEVLKPAHFLKICVICLTVIILPITQIWGATAIYSNNEVQLSTFSGKVTNAAGEPLSAISVQRQGVAGGTFTDVKGEYQIKAKKGETLTFSGVEYVALNVKLAEKRTIDIVMNASAESLDEVVVVGYGTQKRSDITNAIATVDV